MQADVVEGGKALLSVAMYMNLEHERIHPGAVAQVLAGIRPDRRLWELLAVGQHRLHQRRPPPLTTTR